MWAAVSVSGWLDGNLLPALVASALLVVTACADDQAQTDAPSASPTNTADSTTSTSREGMTETAAAALPVRHENGQPRVELTPPSLAGALRIEVPEPGSAPLERGAQLRALLPAQARATVLIDGDEHSPESEPVDGDRTRLTLVPNVEPGPHVLTVAAVRDDGLLLAQATAFEVQE